jgi:hypothetical protein
MADVQGGAIDFRENGNGSDTHLTARSNHADSNFAPVCD